MEEAKGVFEEIVEALRASEAERTRLQAIVDGLPAEMRTLEDRVTSDLSTRHEIKLRELSDRYRKNADMDQDEIRKLESQLTAVRAALDEQIRHTTVANEEAAALRQGAMMHNRDAAAAMTALEEELGRLRRQLDSTTREKESLRTQLSETQGKLEALCADTSQTQSRRYPTAEMLDAYFPDSPAHGGAAAAAR